MTCPSFAMLGLPQTASRADVMNSWRQLLLKVHPDKSDAEDATERTQQLNMAKEHALAQIVERETVEAALAAQRVAHEAYMAILEKARKREIERTREMRQRLADREKFMGPIRDAYFKRKDAMRATMQNGKVYK